jgi:hypothetical protein
MEVRSQDHPLANLPPWKRPWYPLYRKVVAPQVQAEWNGKDKDLRTTLENHKKYINVHQKKCFL